MPLVLPQLTIRLDDYNSSSCRPHLGELSRLGSSKRGRLSGGRAPDAWPMVQTACFGEDRSWGLAPLYGLYGGPNTPDSHRVGCHMCYPLGMQTAKETVRSLLDDLPDDCTLDDVLYHLYVVSNLERGRAEADAGNLIPHAQVAEELRRRWVAGHQGQ